jgi:hypothetical protein
MGRGGVEGRLQLGVAESQTESERSQDHDNEGTSTEDGEIIAEIDHVSALLGGLPGLHPNLPG